MSTNGILQYMDWGAGTTTAAAVGTVTGGEIGPGVSPIVHHEGIGGQDQMHGGLNEYSGNVTFNPQGENDVSLMEYAIRTGYTSPAMTALCFEGGATNQHGYRHTGCGIDTLSWTQAVNEALEVSVTWFGTAFAKVASPSPQTKETGNVMMGFNTSITIDSGTYDVQTITANLSNNLTPYGTLDEGSDGTLRNPEGINVGSEAVTLSITMLAPADNDTLCDISADDIDTDIAVVWIASNGVYKVTSTFANLACSTNPMRISGPDELVAWNMELEGQKNASDTVSIVGAAA